MGLPSPTLTLRSLGVIVEASVVLKGDTDGEPAAEEMREQDDEAGEADITESDCASINDVCAEQNQ